MNDFLHFAARNETHDLLHALTKPVAVPKWTTGQGEILTVSKMEEGHLRNTLGYIHRRMKEWDATRATSVARLQDVGEYYINGHLGSEWFDIFSAELARRQRAAAEAAMAALASLSHLGIVIKQV